jgi:hypothetical protein
MTASLCFAARQFQLALVYVAGPLVGATLRRRRVRAQRPRRWVCGSGAAQDALFTDAELPRRTLKDGLIRLSDACCCGAGAGRADGTPPKPR